MPKNSVSSKQPERYQEVIEAYDRLVSFYPDTEYKKKARKYQEEAQTFISQ
ncbi:MAG: hypothetical protein U5L09_05190 [Bacteroidales bacterium]|nr:hypothetical protein [Bacteroidales bacterium]